MTSTRGQRRSEEPPDPIGLRLSGAPSARYRAALARGPGDGAGAKAKRLPHPSKRRRATTSELSSAMILIDVGSPDKSLAQVMELPVSSSSWLGGPARRIPSKLGP